MRLRVVQDSLGREVLDPVEYSLMLLGESPYSKMLKAFVSKAPQKKDTGCRLGYLCSSASLRASRAHGLARHSNV